MNHIEIIYPDNLSPEYQSKIFRILGNNRVKAGPGEQFTGRPVTELVADKDYVVKLRTEYRLPGDASIRFVKQAATRESTLAVHHPEKIWFVFQEIDDSGQTTFQIANITPRLISCDRLRDFVPEITNESYLEFITRIIDLYNYTGQTKQIALDLSLSNFGLDSKNKLFYLDDDSFKWDNFQALCHFLAGLIRSQDWLTTQLMQQLGNAVRDQILKYFKDAHWLTVIAESVQAVFIPEQKEPLRKSLKAALYASKTFTYQTPSFPNVVAIFADIHANAPALERVLDYLEKRGVQHGMILGDIVGYGPHPVQCIDMLRELPDFSVILGNHDHAVATGKTKNTGSTSTAMWTLGWTEKNITEQALEWLRALPPFIHTDKWLAVHGSPRDKTFFNGYVYQMNYVENLDELAKRKLKFCFHGHSHIQRTYYRRNRSDSSSDQEHQNFDSTDHALICPGSVGQPRGGKPGAEIAIFDQQSHELEFIRLDYDMEPVLVDMANYRFPSSLKQRLLDGR